MMRILKIREITRMADGAGVPPPPPPPPLLSSIQTPPPPPKSGGKKPSKSTQGPGSTVELADALVLALKQKKPKVADAEHADKQREQKEAEEKKKKEEEERKKKEQEEIKKKEE